MDRRTPPDTAEGWYMLHDFRTVDWDAWREAPARRRERALADGVAYLEAAEAVADADSGGSTSVAVLGHEADLCFIHLRPTLSDLNALERRFERTELAAFTEHSDSYVSVTEASGYGGANDYFDPDAEADPGMKRYIESRLHPDIPDADYVSFYPMDKRRDPEYNWYDLPFDERAEHVSSHGDIGKTYAGKVRQIISGSAGLDDHEWGVTLFADDPADIKDLLYEMRFDPSSSKFAEFGRFRIGRQFEPAKLGAYMAGESLTGEPSEATDSPHATGTGREHGGEADGFPHGNESGRSHGDGSHDHDHGHGGDHAQGDDAGGAPDGVRSELEDLGVYAGKPHGEDVHAVVLYSAADPDELFAEADGLRTNFDHYDTHVMTAVYEPTEVASDDAETAVASLWETESAAETAAGFLADLPEVVRQAGDGADDSWGTMGMFYTVKPDSRTDFVDTFADVGEALSGMDGHRKTDLLANREDENDMFIASRWDSREDAMAFFRSDDFAETVEYGRDVLEERPRHVFLA
ncbi:chlorite dismutase [Halovivax asiaticus JCM 14624]|uniref:Chlorite dismutase n=1 Tax=Halovivax asiaticus JCM 14624 TaxID=1227490 RepID=M0BHX3_9EURY|nr:heme-binding protein [Halovivax asiaticus]ELZ09254.1 chlorite dismutase [Halovivax asiaticus JCM 14624]